MTPKARDLDQARELTVLAWRRTILRGVIIAVVAARVFSHEFGAVVIVIALATVGVGIWLNFAASREFSDVRSGSGLPSPWIPDALRRPTARLGITAGGCLILGLASLWWVWLG
jgi:hypothetical protein